jgi:hypothetical protein
MKITLTFVCRAFVREFALRQNESLPNLPLFASGLVLVGQKPPVSYCAGIAPLLGWFGVMAMIPTGSTPLQFTLTGSFKAAAAFHPRLERPGFSREFSISKLPHFSTLLPLSSLSPDVGQIFSPTPCRHKMKRNGQT